MALSATNNAASRIKDFITKRGHGIGLRVGVKTTGCSGLAYKLEFVDQINEDDVVFLTNDIKIIVDYPQYLLPEITKDMKVATLFINTKDDYFSKKYELVSGVDINEQNIIIRFLFSPYYAIRKIILQR